MDERLIELERAAAADPGDLSLQLDLIRAYQRQPPPDGDAQLAAFLAVLETPSLERSAVAAWLRERCDRQQLTALFLAVFDQAAPYLRDRALWILGACEPDSVFPLLLDLAERHPDKGRGAIGRLLDLAAARPDLAERCRAILDDETLTSERVRGWLAESLEARRG